MSVNSKMTAIADKVRTLLGISGKIGLDAMEDNLGTAVEACDSQAALIAQIKTVLEGKAAGGGSGGMVVCEETEVSKNTTINQLKGVRLSLPNATSIGTDAFKNCTSLTSIDFPVATSIGNSAFYYCSSLTSIDLPMATSIGDGVFNSCTSLTSVDFPMATSIGNSAFYYCSSLTSVDFPMATSIGDGVFDSCTSLTSVDFPMATSIGDGVFYYCSSLTSIDLPVATSIGEYAFQKCTSLTSVDFPMATSIENGAFNSCTALETLILRNPDEVCQIIVTAVLGTKIVTLEGVPTGEGFIYVPSALYEGYVQLIAYQAEQLTGDAAMAEYIARAVLRKIEDYPEICG